MKHSVFKTAKRISISEVWSLDCFILIEANTLYVTRYMNKSSQAMLAFFEADLPSSTAVWCCDYVLIYHFYYIYVFWNRKMLGIQKEFLYAHQPLNVICDT